MNHQFHIKFFKMKKIKFYIRVNVETTSIMEKEFYLIIILLQMAKMKQL